MRRCLCNDGDATIDNDDAVIDDDNATIDSGDAGDDANAHTAHSTGQYTPPGTRRHAGHHTTPPTIKHTVKAICSSNSVLRKSVINCSDGNSCAVCLVRHARASHVLLLYYLTGKYRIVYHRIVIVA